MVSLFYGGVEFVCYRNNVVDGFFFFFMCMGIENDVFAYVCSFHMLSLIVS